MSGHCLFRAMVLAYRNVVEVLVVVDVLGDDSLHSIRSL